MQRPERGCIVVEEWNPTNVTGVPTTTVLIHVNNERGGAKLSTRPAFLIHEPVPRSYSFFFFFLFFSPLPSLSFCSRATRNKYKRELDEKSGCSSIFWPIESYLSDQSLHGDAKEAICTLLYDPINFYYHQVSPWWSSRVFSMRIWFDTRGFIREAFCRISLICATSQILFSIEMRSDNFSLLNYFLTQFFRWFLKAKILV